jgi:hypothetical protein
VLLDDVEHDVGGEGGVAVMLPVMVIVLPSHVVLCCGVLLQLLLSLLLLLPLLRQYG